MKACENCGHKEVCGDTIGWNANYCWLWMPIFSPEEKQDIFNVLKEYPVENTVEKYQIFHRNLMQKMRSWIE